MKKLLATLLLTLPSLSQAAIIYTDEALFLADYEGPTGLIDFSTYVPTSAPTESSGNVDSLRSYVFGPEVFFDTRTTRDLGSVWDAVGRNKAGGNIFAWDIQYTEGERIGVSTTNHSVVALYTTAGFFGWAPEFGGLEINDTLFLLPIDAQVQSVQWGFSLKPVEAPEPAPILLLLAGLAAMALRKTRVRP